MSKIDDAVAKITEECVEKEHLVPFEEYLTSICKTDAVAEKILDEKKTLNGCYKAMEDVARKRKTGNSAYIPPSEGFEIIEAYYGITDADKAVKRTGNIIDITDFL